MKHMKARAATTRLCQEVEWDTVLDGQPAG